MAALPGMKVFKVLGYLAWCSLFLSILCCWLPSLGSCLSARCSLCAVVVLLNQSNFSLRLLVCLNFYGKGPTLYWKPSDVREGIVPLALKHPSAPCEAKHERIKFQLNSHSFITDSASTHIPLAWDDAGAVRDQKPGVMDLPCCF